MLRPATPLTILLTAALALLIISVVSAPVSKSIYLGKTGDTIFGVLGRCTGDKCSSAGIGYDVTADGSSKFSMPDYVRQTLSKTLILHPVAAAFTLVMLVMAGASHFHAAAHSARYLLALCIFTLIAFLLALAAAIIDFILFVPHTTFGTYIVLAAAVALFISTIVTFSMRRSMVGRKARRRRIAENAEMSGENYYNREDPLKPTMSGAAAGADGLPVFASYERTPQKDDQVSDERIPLTQVRTADHSPATNATNLANVGSSNSTSPDRYGGPPGQGDPYGPQAQGFGPNGRPSRGSMPGYRGGGAPQGGRGGFNSYGSQARRRDSYGRSGMSPPGRGSPYGQPRDGYGGPAMSGAAAAGGVMAGGAMGRGGRQGFDQRSAPGTYNGYGNQPANGQGDYRNWGSQGTPSRANTEIDLPRAESPPPLPAEASASAGFRQPTEMAPGASGHHGYGAAAATANSEYDADATGMIHTQQVHPVGQPRPGYLSDASKYSTDEYVPPRAAWNQASGGRSPRGQSPVYGVDRRPSVPDYRGPTSPLAAGPNAYYEDVEPRYESPAPHTGLVSASPGPMYEDTHAMDGSRSPTGSVRSNFTSVSQRGINPRWNPHHHPMPGNGARRAVQQRQDMILDNPDFQLAAGRSGKPKHGNPSGLVPGSAYPNAPI